VGETREGTEEIKQGRNWRDQPGNEWERLAREGVGEIRQGRRWRDQPGKVGEINKERSRRKDILNGDRD
jgi:hypothetical protein